MSDLQDDGDALRRKYGIDGTAGDAQDVEHPYVPAEGQEYCALCGLAPVTRKHVMLPADMLATPESTAVRELDHADADADKADWLHDWKRDQ